MSLCSRVFLSTLLSLSLSVSVCPSLSLSVCLSPSPCVASWCFKPSQPQRITSGLKETFKKRYIVERISKAEIRPGEQSEKAESCWENLWNEIQLEGP